jgi:hypothetical protein
MATRIIRRMQDEMKRPAMLWVYVGIYIVLWRDQIGEPAKIASAVAGAVLRTIGG